VSNGPTVIIITPAYNAGAFLSETMASVVAQTLAAASDGRQVLCVTHLAPIAAVADQHLHVTKSIRAGRTRVTVEPLEADGRVEEVARMLGGATTTTAARQHARDLLGARRSKR